MKGDMLVKAVESVTDAWKKQRKKEESRPQARTQRRVRMYSSEYEYSTRVTIKEAAYDCMEEAYMKASANGTLPAHARQIFYAARPTILENAQDRHGETPELQSVYFTQTLLPDYMNEHPEAADWDVVFDARGHFTEPHTKKIVPLGTLGVRDYLRRTTSIINDVNMPQLDDECETCGPANRFGAVLFIEKEGFLPLFEAVDLAERYDIAIMSTKGMSVTAARSLVENVCGIHHIPLLILRDFDVAGFAIAASFQKNTRRFEFSQSFKVVDLGLRMEDVEKCGLGAEPVSYRSDPSANLAENGATGEEIEFLCDNRVELNAFASDDFIEWIESKLKEYGVKKVVPDEDTLRQAYAMAVKVAYVNRAIKVAMKDVRKAAGRYKMPDNLGAQLRRRLVGNDAAWDELIAAEATKAVRKRWAKEQK